jgi:hypothetical protein
VRKETSTLHGITHLPAHIDQVCVIEEDPIDQHVTSVGYHQTVNKLQQSGFATATFADNGSGEIGLNCELQIWNDRMITVGLANLA